MSSLPEGWTIEEADGHQHLTRDFRFDDFQGSVDFVNRVAVVADAAGHHPELLVTWGRVRVRSWSHDAGGLTDRDYQLATGISAAFSAS